MFDRILNMYSPFCGAKWLAHVEAILMRAAIVMRAAPSTELLGGVARLHGATQNTAPGILTPE